MLALRTRKILFFLPLNKNKLGDCYVVGFYYYNTPLQLNYLLRKCHVVIIIIASAFVVPDFVSIYIIGKIFEEMIEYWVLGITKPNKCFFHLFSLSLYSFVSLLPPSNNNTSFDLSLDLSPSLSLCLSLSLRFTAFVKFVENAVFCMKLVAS